MVQAAANTSLVLMAAALLDRTGVHGAGFMTFQPLQCRTLRGEDLVFSQLLLVRFLLLFSKIILKIFQSLLQKVFVHLVHLVYGRHTPIPSFFPPTSPFFLACLAP